MVDRNVDWSRRAWIAFGAVLGAALLLVLYSFVGTVVFGVFLYYATRPLYRRVYRRLRQRTLAALGALFLLALPVIVLLYYTIAIALQEFDQFADSVDLGPYEAMVEPYLDISEVVANPQGLLTDGAVPGAVVDTLGELLAYLGFIGTGLIHVFVMFAIAFYLLRDGDRLAEWAKGFVDHRGAFDGYFRAVDRSFHRVFYGNILNAIVTGAIGAIVFSVVDLFAPSGMAVPYPALTGLLAGAASLIPIIGMKIVYVPVTAYLGVRAALGSGAWWFVAAFAGLAFVVVDVIPDLLVRPYVSSGGGFSVGPFGSDSADQSRDSSLHTGLLMFAYVLGPFLFGWYGIFLAPMVLVLVVHFVRLVLPELLTGTPVRPEAVDPTNLVGDDTDGAGTAATDGSTEPTSDDPPDHGDPTVE